MLLCAQHFAAGILLMHTHITHFRFLLDICLWSIFGLRPDRTAMCVLGARRVRAAALFCPPVEEPEREAGPAAMGHPPWGSEHGLHVVDVNAGGALERREPELQLPSQWARG